MDLNNAMDYGGGAPDGIPESGGCYANIGTEAGLAGRRSEQSGG